MSDDSMDLCGAIWNHEIAMRRLLSLLRQSQNTCNDIECFNPGPSNQNSTGGDFMLMTLCWMAVAFVLYFMRPSSIRNRESNLKPRRNNGNGDGGDPPVSPNAF